MLEELWLLVWQRRVKVKTEPRCTFTVFLRDQKAHVINEGWAHFTHFHPLSLYPRYTHTHIELNIVDGCTHPCPEASTLWRGFNYVLHPSITTLQFPNAASFFSCLSIWVFLTMENSKLQTSLFSYWNFHRQTFHLNWFVFVVEAPTYSIYAYSLVHRCFLSRAGASEWPGVHEQQTKSKIMSIKASHSPVTGDKVNFFPNVHVSVL